MAGLIDTIKQQLATPAQIPQGGQTEAVRGLLRGKLGKQAEGPVVPQQTEVGEEMAQQQTQAGLRDIAQKGQIEGAQLGQQQADIQQQSEQSRRTSQEKMEDMQSKFSMQVTSILDELRQSGEALDNARNLSKMEQAGFMIRGTNNNYVQELGRQGKLANLSSDLDFKTAAAESVFQDTQDLFKDDLAFRSIMDAGDRELEAALAKMSDDFAIKAGEAASKQAATTSMISGLSSLGGAGIQYAKDVKAEKREAANDAFVAAQREKEEEE